MPTIQEERIANAAARWETIQRLKHRRPWLRYTAVLDNRADPLHRAWHGTILPADDPWWDTHYPPNGPDCRCSVQQLSDRDLIRRGETLSARPPLNYIEAVDPEPGEVVSTPEGIAPGWARNVGKSQL